MFYRYIVQRYRTPLRREQIFQLYILLIQQHVSAKHKPPSGYKVIKVT